MEETRRSRARPRARPILTWVVMAAGPAVGTTLAFAIAQALGVPDTSLMLPAGAATGFALAVVVVLRMAMVRKDDLRP